MKRLIHAIFLPWVCIVFIMLIFEASFTATADEKGRAAAAGPDNPPIRDISLEEPFPGTRVITELKARQERMVKDNAPKVFTLKSGTKVQPTPSDPIAFNTYFLDADNRGCRSCHNDLGVTLRKMPYAHLDMGHMFGIDLTVTHCTGCHTYSPEHIKQPYTFGRLMHSMHRQSRGFSGDCISCHDYTEKDGKFRLWDEVKYQAFRGIVDLPDVRGDFRFDQNVVTKDEDLFSLNWLYDKNDYLRYASLMSGKELSKEVFDNWTISVTGDVLRPFKARLADLIKEAPVKTTVMKMHCTMNPPGAGLIENVKITGIPLEYVLEKAGGVKPGATAVFPTDSGGYTYPITLEHLKKHQAYLVYEINGRRLSTVHGYPVQLWVDGMGAQTFVKQLSEIRVSSEPVEGMHLYRGWTREQGGYFNKPNLAIFKLKDGQIVQAGIPFTFEGYADAFDESIAGIEISMDRCKTWTRYETTGAATDRWVYWYYTFTPTEPGAYIICVRAVTEKGLASDKPVMLLVNARRQ